MRGDGVYVWAEGAMWTLHSLTGHGCHNWEAGGHWYGTVGIVSIPLGSFSFL